MLLLHNPIEGISTFYGGVLHPLVVPEQVLTMLTVSACLAQQGLASLRHAVPAALGALLVGIAIQPTLAWEPPQAPVLVVALLVGLLVALQQRLPQAAGVALGLWVGGVVGLGTDTATIAYSEERLFQAGAALGAGFVLLCLPVGLETTQRPWQRVVIRVLGSWSAAASLIVLGFSALS